MLIFDLASCSLTNLPDDAVARIVDRIEGVARVVAPARLAQADALGLDVDELQAPPSGTRSTFQPYRFRDAEVVSRDGELAALVLRMDRDGAVLDADSGEIVVDERGRTTLFCGSVSPNANGTLLPAIQAAVREVFDAELEVNNRQSRRFRELLDEGRVPTSAPAEDEVEAARALADGPVRRLALSVKAAGGLLVSDLPSQLGGASADEVERARSVLENAGLATSDVVVVCSKGGGQLNRLDDRGTLAVLAEHGVRCSCGRPIDEETCEDALAISELGRDLLDGSRWMTILLVDELARCGIRPDQVLIEQATGGDEMDAIADIYGSIALFELKDKTFSLGHAYSFGAKMGILRPDIPIIITTETVGNDAKTHFEARRRSAQRPAGARRRSVEDEPEVRYVEGLETLREHIEGYTSELAITRATGIFQDALQLASLGAEDVLATVDSSGSA